MAEPIFTIIALAIAIAYPTGSEPLGLLRTGTSLEIAGISLPSTVLWTLLVVCLFGLWTAYFYRSADAGTGASPDLARRRFANRILALVLYALTVYVFHFPLWVSVTASYTITVLLSLIPYFAMSGIAGWLGALRETASNPEETAGGNLGFGLRSFGAFSLVPITAILVLLDLFTQIEPLTRLTYVYPFVAWIALLLLVLAFVILSPFVLRILFGAKQMPKGPLRERLEALCARANFKAADLLVIPAGRTGIANAFIVGLRARTRYVFFTDYLLEGMKPEEVECVFAHEMAHAKKRHLPAFIYFSVGSIIMANLVFQAVTRTFPDHALIPMALLPAMLFVWVGSFSFVSRRFESEADLWGAQMCRDPRLFMNTLSRISELNRVPPDVGSLRHFSIAERIQMLYAVRLSPTYGAYIYRLAETLRKVCFYGFVLAAALLLPVIVGQFLQSKHRREAYGAILEADTATKMIREHRFEEAEAIFERATRRLRRNGAEELAVARAELYLAWARVGQGKLDAAQENLKEAGRIGLRGPLDRLRLERLSRAVE